MKRFLLGLLGAAAGYVVAAFAGYALIDALASNRHDRSVEAAMTSAFVIGPMGAVIGFGVGFVLGGRGAGTKRTGAG